MKKEKIILKSTHPDEYPDLEVECRVIENNEIASYLETIPQERKIVGYKTGEVLARIGIVGEEIHTILKTIVDGKEYILKEEKATVKERLYTDQVTTAVDIVIRNISSTSDEEYVVKREKFDKTYEITSCNDSAIEKNGYSYIRCIPAYDPRVITQIDENLIIMTSWGEPAICLAGSYIVTYNADENDYNTIEQNAFKSTYSIEYSKTKVLRNKQ